MRITSIESKPTADRSRATRRTAASGTAFGQCLAEAVAADGASAPERASAPDALFSIQEIDTATNRDSRGRGIRRADYLLDQLSDLQADLLAGAVPAARLQALTDVLRSKREGVDDPRLSDLIDEIELRAEVELAKFGSQS
jgi:hypothetical protein